MDSNKELFKELANYLTGNVDLMKHLSAGACWQYEIMENNLEEEPFLTFFLVKVAEDKLEINENKLTRKPDLILFFTKKAIQFLIKEKPDAKKYYQMYKDLMNNPRDGMYIDNKVNKSKIQLYKIGYKKWKEDFNF